MRKLSIYNQFSISVIFMVFRRKKPHKRIYRHPNFPYLFDPEPDEGKRFKKHHVPITL